jgi:hypothetical protein
MLEICGDGKDWLVHVAARVWLKALDRVCGDPQAMPGRFSSWPSTFMTNSTVVPGWTADP